MTKKKSPTGALLLTPGAGADRNQSALVAIEKALEPQGVVVERMDFPYRKAGRKAPDRAPVLIEAIREGAAELLDRTGLGPDRLALGGRSMGGRMCSMAAAEGLSCSALVLISYPLHPPGKPEKLRVEHFPAITVPSLLISGTRDAFGTPAELEAETVAIAGSVDYRWVEGGTHGLRGADATVATTVAMWLSAVWGGTNS